MDSITKQKSLGTMADELISFLGQIGFNQYHIRKYRLNVEKIKHFMSEQGLINYTANECDFFIRQIIGNGEYRNLSRNDKDAIRCANILIEYQVTGIISYRIKRGIELLHGPVGNDIQSYLDYRKSIDISPATLYDTRLYLGRFQKYLDSVGRNNLLELTQRDILGFIRSISYSTKATIHCTLCALRGFLRYLNSEGILVMDWSYLVPKDSYKKEAKKECITVRRYSVCAYTTFIRKIFCKEVSQIICEISWFHGCFTSGKTKAHIWFTSLISFGYISDVTLRYLLEY